MICCIFNYASHYREPVYLKLQEDLGVVFYFGKSLRDDKIKKLNFTKISGYKKELDVKFFSFPLPWEWCKGMIKLAFVKEYQRFIITPNYFALNQWIFLTICVILRKQVYSWEHGIISKEIRPFWIFIDKVFHKFLTASFIYGNKAKNNMEELGYNKSKLHVIYNSLDYDNSVYLRSKLDIDINNRMIYRSHFKNPNETLLFIGRLTKVKNLRLLIKAHASLMLKDIHTNLIIIGDGELLTELKYLAIECGFPERIWFYGDTYDEYEIASLLFYADLCISPGNVGLTAIHAFSYGLPVITNDDYTSQMPEHEIIVDGVNGLFFRKDDLNSLVEKIEFWLSTKKNRDLIRKLCYQPVDRYYNPNYQSSIIKKVLNVN